MSGLDIHYDLGPGHPLLGRRMPDLNVVTESGPRRVFSLLHAARPVLLNFGEACALDIGPWAERASAGRCALRGRMGSAGARHRFGPHCGVDSARWLHRVGC